MPSPTWLPEAIAKYRRELDHVKLRPQIAGLLEEAHQKGAKALLEANFLDSRVKPVLDKHAVDLDTRLGYYAYSRALNRSQRILEFMVDRIREHEILRARWETRGLDPDILDELDRFLIFAQGQP